MTGEAPVREHHEGGIAWITLNRPERRNALGAAMVEAITAALTRAAETEGCRVVVLRGAGPDFCAGADLREMSQGAERPASEQLAEARRLGALFLRIRGMSIPVVAAVHGRALAGGCGLATACDVVLASATARFGYPEVGIGFVPAMVMTMLRRTMGEKRAFDLVATGRLFDAAEGERLGVVSRVLPEAGFDREVESYAAAMASRSTTALGLSKRLLYAQDEMGFEAGIRAGAEVNVLARSTDDARVGIAGFAGGGGG